MEIRFEFRPNMKWALNTSLKKAIKRTEIHKRLRIHELKSPWPAGWVDPKIWLSLKN